MYKSKSILGLITARGGSVGIPNKNITMLGGKPLIAWSIDAAKNSSYIDRLVLSSDSKKIIDVAIEFGCEVPFVRPEKLAQDETASMPVILHAIEALKETYDYLLLLQPTSPFRTSEQIDQIIKYCIDMEAPLMVSVKRSSKHPCQMFRHVEGRLTPFFQDNPIQRRQDAPAAYEHNGALYCSKTSYLLKHQSYCTTDCRAFIMEGYSNLDIDEPEDLDYAQYLIDTGKI